MNNILVWVFLLNLISTLFLVGLIWTIQLVHYPSFMYSDKSTFQDMVSFHQIRISLLVVPLMFIEVVTCTMLLWKRPEYISHMSIIFGFLLVSVIWISTFAFQVPLHEKLKMGMDIQTIQRLVKTNWIRTIAWTGRALLLSWTLLNGLIS